MGQQKGNPSPSYQNQAYETLRPNTGARVNRDMGTKPVMIDDTKTLDELIDSGSQGFTQGYAKDTDLTDGTINARFDTLTANEYHVTILSSSVMYANGSNKFGDSADDKHEFTGSILVSGDVLGNTRLNQATASLQFNSASVDAQLARVYQATASLNTFTGSLSSSLHDGSKNVSFNNVSATSNGLGQNFKVGDDVWLGDRNVSNTMVVSGIQEPTSAIIQLGSGSQPSIAHLVEGAPFPSIGSAVAITGSLLLGHNGRLYFFNGGASNGGWAQII
jgi:hypothetical protein